jgi:predicted ester cyclase
MTDTITAESLLDPRPELVKPRSLTVDGSLDPGRARHLVRTGQALYTFWPQGIDGPAAASANFRAAVPDLACELSDLLVAGDKLAVRLRFTGSFTGAFNGIAGAGQPVDFIAFDIQQVGPDRITEDWHLEDNLTFLLQAGLATVAHA